MGSLAAKSKSPTNSGNPFGNLNVDGGPPPASKKGGKDEAGASGTGEAAEQDSFYKLYNKEIKVEQDQIPIILSELTDAAHNLIVRDSFDKALMLLQKAEGVLEVVKLDGSVRDRYLLFLVNNNMSLCF